MRDGATKAVEPTVDGAITRHPVDNPHGGSLRRSGKMKMDVNNKKIADDVLALLFLTGHRSGKNDPWRAWKGHDWEVMDLLFEQGFISDPKSKSVVFTDEGYMRAKELFEQKYTVVEPEAGSGGNA